MENIENSLYGGMNFKNRQRTIDEIKKKVAENKTEKVFETLSELAKKTNVDLKNQLILVQSRYNAWKTDDQKGFKPERSEMNLILSNLLDLVDKFEKEIDQPDEEELDNLANTLNNAQINLTRIRTKIEYNMNFETTFLGKIWMALMPQVEGTLMTICKILFEIREFVKLESQVKKMKDEYGVDIELNISPYSKNIISEQDISKVEKLHKTMMDTYITNKQSKQKVHSANKNGFCSCGSGKKFINCHGHI